MILKKKCFKRTKVIFSLLMVCLCFFSCATADFLKCPYVISEPCVKLGEIEGQQKFAGTHFSVYNDSERNIYSITVSFMVYDSDGNNPFIGSNCVVSKIPAEIGPDETKEFVVNLDPYISIAPEEPYLIDFIYLREIHYEDGKKWTDRYGMFAAREVYE